jgi:CheY-like chemotaxis protein
MTALPATNSQTSAGSKPLIYVVDDEAMLLELATVILEPLGYSIVSFRDPNEALKAYATADPRPNLIITDYAMHSMNGMDLIEKCRRIKADQKILLLSGTVGAEVFHHTASKPDRFLPKPYHAHQLVDLVKAMLGR